MWTNGKKTTGPCREKIGVFNDISKIVWLPSNLSSQNFLQTCIYCTCLNKIRLLIHICIRWTRTVLFRPSYTSRLSQLMKYVWNEKNDPWPYLFYTILMTGNFQNLIIPESHVERVIFYRTGIFLSVLPHIRELNSKKGQSWWQQDAWCYICSTKKSQHRKNMQQIHID